ncbi:MAG TPA: AtpZ/AtpI family protein [Candidatus Acidoferrum sp.]|nr:AtpZ/AtpI family protein [Candidatus Acidoferrum sp.]
MDSENPKKTEQAPPKKTPSQQFNTEVGLAMELPFLLFGAIAVGGLFGYFLDKWLHTKFLFMVILGGLGFFAGVRDVLRRLPTDGDGKH